MSVSVVDFYLRRRCIRVEIPMGRFARTSDMLNNPTGEFLEGRCLTIESGSGGQDATPEASNIAVRLSEVSFAHPISEPPAPSSASEQRERFPQPVVLEIDDWQMTGTLFLVDRINWIDFLANARGLFLPVRNVSVRLGDSADSSQYPFILVNGSRIGALYSAD